ncbi:LapA family protein [Aldersonia kunmingensis]|uniref:LapA family protein n=1 Tax=Aldersonia kunmingensis TaxID=408066 RepID=UPI000832DF75|nr:lipopolysaccharide assembly protein LapA domain-containing protein [Aldersonia kunmingensis]
MASNPDPPTQSGSEPDASPRPADQSQAPPPTPPIRKIKRTRVSSAWMALIVGLVVLVMLLIFILQNLDSVPINILFWEFSLPLGVAVLLAAIMGAVIMAIVGGVRILQIRKVAKQPPAPRRKA